MATVAATATDAILVAEEWISQQYFTADAKTESFTARVLARRKDWDGRKDEGTPRTRLVAARQRLLSTFATLTSDYDKPQPEETGSVGSIDWRRVRRSRPSLPLVVSRA